MEAEKEVEVDGECSFTGEIHNGDDADDCVDYDEIIGMDGD